jgi:hypothetical protein
MRSKNCNLYVKIRLEEIKKKTKTAKISMLGEVENFFETFKKIVKIESFNQTRQNQLRSRANKQFNFFFITIRN